jgi:pimeloyl-ACP methyl ester carboxylesterase
MFIELASSPLAPDASPVRIHVRTFGDGPPIVFLHGGWGYEVYSIERQLDALASNFRIVVADRSGYGRSTPIESLPIDFHRRAADETRAVLAELDIERPILWGHSDGAIIALLVCLADPDCAAGLILEAAHYVKRKPRSRAFFESIVADPNAVGANVAAALERDHGEEWGSMLERHSRTWLAIGDAASAQEDFYDGRLSQVQTPVLLVHGLRDPRTEPGELEAIRAALALVTADAAASEDVILENGGHSPHSERATADAVTAAIVRFADRITSSRRAPGAVSVADPPDRPNPPDPRDPPDPPDLPDLPDPPDLRDPPDPPDPPDLRDPPDPPDLRDQR